MSEEILELNHIDYTTPKILNPSKMTEKIDIPVNPNRFDECLGGEQIPIIFNNLKPCCWFDGSKSTLSLQLQVNVPPPVLDTDPAFFRFDIDRRYDSGASIINVLKLELADDLFKILLNSESGPNFLSINELF